MVGTLCKEREANKTNTHYLTDGIIRSCLNQEGKTENIDRLQQSILKYIFRFIFRCESKAKILKFILHDNSQ